MLEIAETKVIAQQMNELTKGKPIKEIIVGEFGHKFAWYYDPVENYDTYLIGNQIIEVNSLGSMIEIKFNNEIIMILGEGEEILYFDQTMNIPTKHQLLVLFDDDSGFTVRVKLYGWLLVGKMSDLYKDIFYYKLAKDRPNVLSSFFTYNYFYHQIILPNQNQSIKAILSTKQNIPGLGNGTIQDILWSVNINPKTKGSTLNEVTTEILYEAITGVVSSMIANKGRSTETTFLGESGGYHVIMSSKNVLCPKCHHPIISENYLGGKVYYCNTCQPYKK